MRRLRSTGKIRRPTAEELSDLAELSFLRLTPQEALDLEELSEGLLSTLDRLDDLPQPRWPIRYTDRDPGYRPTAEEDPYNIFIRKCRVSGAPDGPLAGKKVGLKDNIAVAGIPLTNGSRLAAGYVPDCDASVVERLLDAGAEIVGKLNMDSFALSPSAETSEFGYARNPRNPDHSPGGSSGGSGAAVANGDVDIALGVDEGGSGRIPAAWCGITSIKATHGLVPSFGLTYMDHTLDFICPMARTAQEVAQTLEVIAGDDPRDPQWVRGPIQTEPYTQALTTDINGLRLGIVKEGLEGRAVEPEVVDAFQKGVAQIGSLGAVCTEISLPMFKNAWAIWTGIASHSIPAMVESDGEGYGHGGASNVGWVETFGRARRARANDLPPFLKLILPVGNYLRREYNNRYYALAQNLRLSFTQQIEHALQEVDILALPTTPMRAPRLEAGLSLKDLVRRSAAAGQNTSPFNLSGHPALNLPCGLRDGLPVGLQLVGRRWQESTLLRVAYAFEHSVDWERL